MKLSFFNPNILWKMRIRYCKYKFLLCKGYSSRRKKAFLVEVRTVREKSLIMGERLLKIMETERLYLRELTLDDTQDLSKVLTEPESMQYYPEPFSLEKVEKWIKWNMDNYVKYNHGLWAVILKDGEEFVGDCGITMQMIENESVPEIGFHIIKDYWNKGYATEAAMACKNYAFEVLNYPKIFSYTTIRNIPSQKVAEKIGMQQYKIFEKNGEPQIVQVAIHDRES